jgi:hypothetical protein
MNEDLREGYIGKKQGQKTETSKARHKKREQ